VINMISRLDRRSSINFHFIQHVFLISLQLSTRLSVSFGFWYPSDYLLHIWSCYCWTLMKIDLLQLKLMWIYFKLFFKYFSIQVQLLQQHTLSVLGVLAYPQAICFIFGDVIVVDCSCGVIFVDMLTIDFKLDLSGCTQGSSWSVARPPLSLIQILHISWLLVDCHVLTHEASNLISEYLIDFGGNFSKFCGVEMMHKIFLWVTHVDCDVFVAHIF